MGKANGRLAMVPALMLMLGCSSVSEFIREGGIETGDRAPPRVNFTAIRQMGRVNCGAACLSAVFDYWGEQIPQQDIVAALGRPRESGYSLKQLQVYATRLGYDAFLLEGSLEELKKQTGLGRPCIILYQTTRTDNHSVVVITVEDGDDGALWVVMDPADGTIKRIRQRCLQSPWQAIGCPLLLVGIREQGGDIESMR